MEKEKKSKMINILIGVGLGALIFFVLVTAIVLHKKNNELEDLNEKNDMVKPSESVVRFVDYKAEF